MCFYFLVIPGISIGNQEQKMENKVVHKIVFLDVPSEVLRPLYNSNVTKVSVVKYYQNLICLARSPVSGIPKGLGGKMQRKYL